VDAATARLLAEQAVQRLNDLHAWIPTGDAEQALRESPVHEGFVSRAMLVTEIERIAAADRDAVMPRRLIDGLMAIAQCAPEHARADVPVHADCDWGNWLARDRSVTALLDFERARFGEPADDWVLLAVTSGPHLDIVVDAIAEVTTIGPDVLRAECEFRDAALIADDIRYALEQPNAPAGLAHRVRDLEGLVLGRRWQHHNQ
jgi:aminoglycoside phosphotransferase (APT) family kinase protein